MIPTEKGAVGNFLAIQGMNFQKMPKSNTHHLNSLKKLVKILYDDMSYEIINYIINLGNSPAEEQKLADDLNLSYNQVRTSLIMMEKHGILLSSEFKKKREDEEGEETGVTPAPNTTSTNSGGNKPPGSYRNYSGNMRKNKTSEWTLNMTYYNRIKNRFQELKTKLEKNLEYRSKLKFECGKCKTIYQEFEAAHRGYVCTKCEDKPKLIEKKAEDVTNLRKKSNEILTMLNDLFLQSDRYGPDFQNMQLIRNLNKPKTGDKKTVNGNLGKLNQMNLTKEQKEFLLKNQNDFIIASSLEDPYIEENLKNIKKDDNKLKKFKEILEFYTIGK
jgi:hypothetical protein